jgi:peptidoglycan-N-acetylglucosamine deacetylase
VSNGAGVAIAGVVIGIVLAAQADEFTPVELPDPPDLTQPSAAEDGTDSDGAGSTGSGSGGSGSGASGDSSDADPPHGLTTPGVITSLDGADRVVALTFSSGPDPEYTPQVLDALERHQVIATFCLTGEEVRENPIVVQNIVAAGHTLCNQGETLAYNLADRDDDAIRAEIRGGLEAIQAAAPDADVPFFRAPGGCFSAEVNEIAEEFGHEPLGWDVDPRDWERTNSDDIARAVVDDVEPGSIVVLHDGDGDRSATVAALDPMIEQLRDADYGFAVPDAR